MIVSGNHVVFGQAAVCAVFVKVCSRGNITVCTHPYAGKLTYLSLLCSSFGPKIAVVPNSWFFLETAVRARGWFAAVAALAALPALAGPGKELAGPVPATVVEVTDGDTLVVRAHIWIGQEVETSIRLSGVDTPELHGKCDEEKARARDARDFTEKLTGGGPVFLTGIRPDKYGGRVDASVRTSDGTDLAAALIKAGLARPYGGERRKGWCEG
jgi:micrococcal nuclease